MCLCFFLWYISFCSPQLRIWYHSFVTRECEHMENLNSTNLRVLSLTRETKSGLRVSRLPWIWAQYLLVIIVVPLVWVTERAQSAYHERSMKHLFLSYISSQEDLPTNWQEGNKCKTFCSVWCKGENEVLWSFPRTEVDWNGCWMFLQEWHIWKDHTNPEGYT